MKEKENGFMTLIEIKKLNVSLNGKPVLKDISLSFTTEERILLLGASGCGKTTLLLSIMGLTQRMDNAECTGDILIDGKPVINKKAYEVAETLGMVFQNPESQFCSLYPEDEIAFGLENLNVEPAQMDDRIRRSLETLHFPKNKYKAAISELSGGEQQRLALASIFAQGAEMMILDEPTANLDPEGRRQVTDASLSLTKSGKGLLVVEHNLENWLPFLKRVIVLNTDGTLLCDGEPRKVFCRYRDVMKQQGIWIPRSVRLYEELAQSGYQLSSIPLNAAELREEKIPDAVLNAAWSRLIHHQPKKHETISPIIQTNGLAIQYKKAAPVFTNVDIQIFPGDFFALVGRNGSGKSTLAKALIKLIEPSAGKISLFGKNIADIPWNDLFASVGYVFQNPEHQFLKDTVWSELEYTVEQTDGYRSKKDRDKKNAHIKALLKEFDLLASAYCNPFSLSGGQKRKLSVAIMLSGNQTVLILDEPTFGQDERNTYSLMEKLAELNRKGTTVCMITHDLDLVEEYANRAAVLCDGSVAFCSNTSDLWKNEPLIQKSGLELPFRIKMLSEAEPTC